MKYLSVNELVGNTPMVNIGTYGNATLWAKLEGCNPTNSLKDRTAEAIVRAYIQSKASGRTLIDASSGSFACALAYWGRLAGLPVTVVVNSKISDDNLAFLKVQGATVIKFGKVTGDSREHCLDLMNGNDDYFFTDQLNNPISPNVHDKGTGAEILRDLPRVTAVIGSKGSGATLCGISRFFARNKPDVKIFGSVGYPGDIGKIAGTYVEGVDYYTPFFEEIALSLNYVEDVSISYESAMKRCQELPVLVGPQGGGVYEAAISAIKKHNLSGDVALIMGDSLGKNASRFK